jgi:hypothetical protein
LASEPKLSRAWRIEHQWWFLPILFPFAWLSWAAFGYLGFRLRRRSWIVAAAAYAATMVLGTILLFGSSWMNVTRLSHPAPPVGLEVRPRADSSAGEA